jgi:hypothetical protein
MAKAKSKLNTASPDVIDANFLSERAEGSADVKDPGEGVVIAKQVPQTERVLFLNGRDPGCELLFHYHSATHPLKHYTLFHGKEYDLPLEVIDHLESCAEKQYGYRAGPNGHPEMYTKALKYIFTCKRVRKAA